MNAPEQLSPEARDLLNQIHLGAYWEVVIRPTFPLVDKVSYTALQGTVHESSVSIRGWNFPQTTETQSAHLIRGADSIEYFSEWNYHKEVWRLYQSGLFAWVGGLWFDWLEPGTTYADAPAENRDRYVPLWDTMYKFLEIYRFARNLSTGPAGAESMTIVHNLKNISNRELFQDDPGKTGFMLPYHVPTEYSTSVVVDRNELVGQYLERAAEQVSEFLNRSGLNISPDGAAIWLREIDRQ